MCFVVKLVMISSVQKGAQFQNVAKLNCCQGFCAGNSKDTTRFQIKLVSGNSLKVHTTVLRLAFFIFFFISDQMSKIKWNKPYTDLHLGRFSFWVKCDQ